MKPQLAKQCPIKTSTQTLRTGSELITVKELQCTHISLTHTLIGNMQTHYRRPCNVRWGRSVRIGQPLWAVPPSPCGSTWPSCPRRHWYSRCNPGHKCAGAPLAGGERGRKGAGTAKERRTKRVEGGDEEKQWRKGTRNMALTLTGSINSVKNISRVINSSYVAAV